MESWQNTGNRTFLYRDALWEVLPSNRLTGMCCWMGAQFLDWIEYNGVAFSRDY